MLLSSLKCFYINAVKLITLPSKKLFDEIQTSSEGSNEKVPKIDNAIKLHVHGKSCPIDTNGKVIVQSINLQIYIRNIFGNRSSIYIESRYPLPCPLQREDDLPDGNDLFSSS